MKIGGKLLERFDRVEAELQKELKEKQKQEADKTE